MTPDGVGPHLDRHRVSIEPTRLLAERQSLADPATDQRGATDPSGERMRRVRVALDCVRDELLRAHALTVLAMGQLGPDHARLSDALAESRSQHEALFLVRGAADALAAPPRLRPSSGAGAPSENRAALTEWRGRTWFGGDQRRREGPTHGGRTED